MIPCFICGQPAENSWTEGFPPAPDSQKLGLCKQHNNKENRAKVEQVWRDYLTAAIGEVTRNSMYRAQGAPGLLRIFFVGGGAISVPCVEFSTPDPDILKVLTPDGENIFFPLRQVRHYALTPLHQEAGQEQSRSLLPELTAQRLSETPDRQPKAKGQQAPEPQHQQAEPTRQLPDAAPPKPALPESAIQLPALAATPKK